MFHVQGYRRRTGNKRSGGGLEEVEQDPAFRISVTVIVRGHRYRNGITAMEPRWLNQVPNPPAPQRSAHLGRIQAGIINIGPATSHPNNAFADKGVIQLRHTMVAVKSLEPNNSMFGLKPNLKKRRTAVNATCCHIPSLRSGLSMVGH